MEIGFWGNKIFISKVIIGIATAIGILALGLTGYAVTRSNNGLIIEKSAAVNLQENKETAAEGAVIGTEDEKVEEKETTKAKDEIKVYIVGCVKNPGIVSLNKGDLVFDAINAAGGATEEADLNNINLAFKLNDNVMLSIRSKKENMEAAKSTPNAAAKVQVQGPAGKGAEITSDSKGAVVNEQPVAAATGMVNINTAGPEQLDTLPGIGIETAKDIISFREKNGSFKKTEDIMKVPGIKGSKFNKIKDRIVVN